MPRGKRQGRANSTSNTQQLSASTSYHQAGTERRRSTSLRRSTRIEERRTRVERHLTQPTMTEVANRFGPTTVSQRSLASNGRRAGSMNGRFSAGPSGYALEIVTQPPSYGILSQPFNEIRVLLQRSHSAVDEDVTQLRVITSLVSAQDAGASSVAMDALSGERSARISPVSIQNGECAVGFGSSIGVSRLTGLAINREGSFKLRIALVRFGNSGHAGGDNGQGAQVLHVVDTDDIIVS